MRWVERLIRQLYISGKGVAFSEWPSGSLVSSPSTFVGRMKLYFINGPSACWIFLFDFRIHLGPLEAPIVPNSPTQYREGSTIEIRL